MSDLHTLLLEQIRERDARVRDALAASQADSSGGPPPEDGSNDNMPDAAGDVTGPEETEHDRDWRGSAPVPRARSGSAMRRQLVAAAALASVGALSASMMLTVANFGIQALTVLVAPVAVAVLALNTGGRLTRGDTKSWQPRGSVNC
ncbi:hypothetical protein ACIBCO_31120 [Streptomyces violascens]|uniref:hypothetical protein n=1 Tax=Streptomyces violascens TaxID=67381 RepID=UPI00379FF297